MHATLYEKCGRLSLISRAITQHRHGVFVNEGVREEGNVTFVKENGLGEWLPEAKKVAQRAGEVYTA
eukprot:2291657-Rhodomonas_salina.2